MAEENREVKSTNPNDPLAWIKYLDACADTVKRGSHIPGVMSGQADDSGMLLCIASDYALFEELEMAARITAMRHAIVTDPKVKALQVEWLKKMETRRTATNMRFMALYSARTPLGPIFNIQGTMTGRFRSDRPNLSNPPRSAKEYPRKAVRKGDFIHYTQGGYTWIEPVREETMETVMGDTIVETAPDLVEIKCGDTKDGGCQHCGEKRKYQVSGKRAEVMKKNPGGNTRVKIMEGELKGKTANCPPERLKPVRAEKIVDEPPPPEPEPAKPEMRNYGYGLACSNCRATKGECHASSCPHAGSIA